MRPSPPDPISSASIVRFLLASGAISSSAIVRADLRLLTSRRDRFALHQVQLNGETPYVVKTVRDSTGAPYLFAEGAVLEWLQSRPQLAGVGPRCRARSRDGTIVVLERIPGDPQERMHAPDGDAKATLLAALHRETWGTGLGVTTVLPPIFDAICRGWTSNQRALSLLLASCPDPAGLVAGLSRTARAWHRGSLIHSDVKPEHWFAHTLNGFERRLIDWELVRVGDPAWDVGSALHDWVSAGPLATAAATFVAAYREAAGPHVWDADFALRAALCTATRLTQTALERLNTGSNSGVAELLHRADGIFRRPEPLAGWIEAAAAGRAG